MTASKQIRARQVHTCTYALIVVFKSKANAAIYAVQKIELITSSDLDLKGSAKTTYEAH